MERVVGMPGKAMADLKNYVKKKMMMGIAGSVMIKISPRCMSETEFLSTQENHFGFLCRRLCLLALEMRCISNETPPFRVKFLAC